VYVAVICVNTVIW